MHKWLSWSAAPAKCSACGAGCCIATVDSSGVASGCLLSLTLFGFAAVAVQAVYPLAIGFVLAVLIYFYSVHRAKLVHVSPAEMQTAERSAILMVFLWFFPGFFS